jgi:outer membrane protein assembly factor BamD
LLTYHIHKHLDKFILLISAVVMLISMVGCSSSEAVKQLSAQERFDLGTKAFKDEDYLAAIEEFKVVSLQFQGSNVADSAQFYLAECRYLREEYILAAFEYDVLIRTMTSSSFTARARFRRATCYYELSPKSHLDQNYSRKAIDNYQDFLEYHPADTLAPLADQRIAELNAKLAKKDFENGITYMHMEYYKAATYYFDVVLEKYHDTPFAEPAMLKKAEALTNRKKYEDAKEVIGKFIAKYPQSALLTDAEKLRITITKKMKDEPVARPKRQVEPLKDTSSQVPQNGG